MEETPIKHFVFDLETLGLLDNAVILSIGIVPFTFESNATFEELVADGIHLKLNVETQVAAGRVIDRKTLKFWQDQGEDAQWILKPSSADVEPDATCHIIAGFLKARGYKEEDSWLWSRGNAFDFGKIENLHAKEGFDMPFPGFMQRDIRTMVDCFCGTKRGRIEATRPQPGFVKHNALHDAASDAAKMIEIYQAIANGE